MARRAHLVGAWPGRDPEHAMELALEHLAPHLDRMTDGETGDRHLWITPGLDGFRANPDVEIVRDGGWTSYEDTARWRVKDGVTLDPDNIRLRYALSFEGSFPPFKASMANSAALRAGTPNGPAAAPDRKVTMPSLTLLAASCADALGPASMAAASSPRHVPRKCFAFIGLFLSPS